MGRRAHQVWRHCTALVNGDTGFAVHAERCHPFLLCNNTRGMVGAAGFIMGNESPTACWRRTDAASRRAAVRLAPMRQSGYLVGTDARIRGQEEVHGGPNAQPRRHLKQDDDTHRGASSLPRIVASTHGSSMPSRAANCALRGTKPCSENKTSTFSVKAPIRAFTG